MTAKKLSDINNLTFEQALSELEDIVSNLERGEAGLDKAMEVYSRGQLLKEYCARKLASSRLQVEKINAENGGNLTISAFNPEE